MIKLTTTTLASACLALSAGLFTVGAACAAGDTVKIGDIAVERALFKSPGNIEKKIEICAQCHSAKGEGSPEYDTPALNSSSANYIAKELKLYRPTKGKPAARKHREMNAMAALLNDADIKELADYYAPIKPAAK
ncbi:c-type cytochrome [Andreprevotia chitinilytica]|uniref:c-type cytochrome n=1 Tax=Andreprevotia chitinilytica TaxID=396808 RepID=UPI00068D1646|nr:c-type cytochrome [Andreprevotia chitinilytica]